MPDRSASTANSHLSFCPRCGETRLEGMRFCGGCRFDFDGVREGPASPGAASSADESATTPADLAFTPVAAPSSERDPSSDTSAPAGTDSGGVQAASGHRVKVIAVVVGALVVVGVAVGGYAFLNADGSRAQYEAFVSRVNDVVDRERQILSSISSAPTTVEYGNVARELSSLADGMVTWLDANSPAPCYSDAWKATRRETLELSSLARFLQAFASSPTPSNWTAYLAELDASKSVAQNAIVLTQDAEAACR